MPSTWNSLIAATMGQAWWYFLLRRPADLDRPMIALGTTTRRAVLVQAEPLLPSADIGFAGPNYPHPTKQFNRHSEIGLGARRPVDRGNYRPALSYKTSKYLSYLSAGSMPAVACSTLTPMTRAAVITRTGGPEVLEIRSVEVGSPKQGQLRIRQTAIGVNFHDTYVRSGQYVGTLALPGIPGVEACGVVEEVGSGVEGYTKGDRIAYLTPRYGGYSEKRILDASLAVHVPPGISDVEAASLMVKATTVAVLIFEVVRLQPDDLILVHAAAGGVGRLLCQWASNLGARVIGTVGSNKKIEIARRAGCFHVVDNSGDNFVDVVRQLSHGEGVKVVYDSVGNDSFDGSLESLRLCGHLVNFGQSSGPVPAVLMSQLSAKSATVSRPMVFHYVQERKALESLTQRAFQAFTEGIISLDTIREYALSDVQDAHRDMEARKIIGTPVLIP